MKKLLFAIMASALIIPAASAQMRVKGYTKKDGTYVAPHYRSKPNGSVHDNYSTKGNYNPYTGKAGTKDPYSTPTLSGASEDKKPAATCTYLCPDE